MISLAQVVSYVLYLMFLIGFFVFSAFSLFHLEEYGYVGDLCRPMMYGYGFAAAIVMLSTFVALIIGV